MKKRQRRLGSYEVPDWLMYGYVVLGVILAIDVLIWIFKK